jgi:hypothetical protein
MGDEERDDEADGSSSSATVDSKARQRRVPSLLFTSSANLTPRPSAVGCRFFVEN